MSHRNPGNLLLIEVREISIIFPKLLIIAMKNRGEGVRGSRRRRGAGAQVQEGGAGFPLLQPQRGGESRYISGTGSEFTREDTASPCYRNLGNIQ